MEKKLLSHALLLIGPPGAERDAAARRLAAGMLCRAANAPCGVCRDCRKAMDGIHPDITVLERGTDDKGRPRRELVVDQIRAAAAEAWVTPGEADGRVCIVREADTMNLAAQNALLKVLEEPPGHAGFVLCAAAADALLATVRSRCVRTDLADARASAPVPPAEGEVADYLRAALRGDRAELVRVCLLCAGFDRDECAGFFTSLRSEVCEMLCARRPCPAGSAARLRHIDALAAECERALRLNLGGKQLFGLLAAETL